MTVSVHILMAHRHGQSPHKTHCSGHLSQHRNQIFRTCADAEFPAPDAHTAAHIKVCIALTHRPIRILVKRILYPVYGPYLSVMGMSAELEIHSGTRASVKMIRLVVEQYCVFCLRRLSHKPRHALPSSLRAVVAAYDR